MRRAWAAVATLSLTVSIVAGSTASAAVDWRAEVPITGSDEGTFVTDASYRSKLSVIAWQIAGVADRALHVAIAHDAGRGAFATRRIAQDAKGMAVAACGDDALVAYRERRADGGLRLRLARIPSDGGSVQRISIRWRVPGRGTMDLACGSKRATVVWTERMGSAWHALVRHVRLVDLGRTRVRDLGVADRVRVATAASGHRAYVAWSDPRGLRFKRFIVGDGPAHRVTSRPTQRLTAHGGKPTVAADGARVTVGYTSASDPEIRVSRDRGATFPASWGYGLDPGDSTFSSLALEGRRIVGTVVFTYLDYEPFVHRLSSADLGGRWTHKSVGQDVVRPLDGLLVTGTGTKLAETFSRSDGDTGASELVFRRQR